MKKAVLFLLTLCLMLGAVAQAIVAVPVLDLTDCIGMESEAYYAYLRDNEKYNPHIKSESRTVTDGEGRTIDAVYRLAISDSGFKVEGLSIGNPFDLRENALLANGWTEVSRDYNGDFYLVYEKAVGEATYRLAVQTLNMNISGLDYSVDNLDAHFANQAAETAAE